MGWYTIHGKGEDNPRGFEVHWDNRKTLTLRVLSASGTPGYREDVLAITYKNNLDPGTAMIYATAMIHDAIAGNLPKGGL